MKKLSKTDCRKRLEEARNKLMLVYAYGESHTSTSIDTQLTKMARELKSIISKLK